MNITPQTPSLSIATVVNPATETLRRDNNQRDIIVKPEAASQSAAEKGLGSEKDRNKTATLNNEQIDFESLRKRAEQESRVIGDGSEKGSEQSSQGSSQEAEETSPETTSEDKQANNSELSEAEEKIVNELQQRDAEVRAHERAHAAVGGANTGNPSYTFNTGPDGKKYAVSGEVSVDLSTVSGDPKATITKMQQVHAAALAPAQPSTQDIKVAAAATRIIAEAQSEILASKFNDVEAESSSDDVITKERFASDDSDGPSRSDAQSNSQSKDFDTLINQTLAAQETIAPTRSQDVVDRASRIESFYSGINQAYEKPPSFQFELTA